jgi:hypothetical protein
MRLQETITMDAEVGLVVWSEGFRGGGGLDRGEYEVAKNNGHEFQ